MNAAPRISVVIPALDEEQGIGATLACLQPLRAAGHEVIVVDGGSADNTIAVSTPLADQVCSAAGGRAVQMNHGIHTSGGDILWFLHADTRVPLQAYREITAAISEHGSAWGRFDIRFDDTHPVLGVVAGLMNLRSRLTAIATGDQGIFVRRDTFLQVGGFPVIPLMEDIALSRALRGYSRPAALEMQLVTSARRWRQAGIFRTILLMWVLRLSYFLGVPPRLLARYYAHARA